VAYAPDVGRARVADVRVLSGRTTDGVKIVLARGEGVAAEPLATGGVAVTLGETPAGLEAAEVVVAAVAEGSEAERAGLAPGDRLLEVGGARVASVTDARSRLSGPVHDDVLVKLRRGERTLLLRVPREQVRR
jgi:S1-C subfamily serine protease